MRFVGFLFFTSFAFLDFIVLFHIADLYPLYCFDGS